MSKSSNVVAARLTAQLGVGKVIRAARDLGISTPIANEASIGLGTSAVSLLELTSAYAAIANGTYPVRPRGLNDEEQADDWLSARLGGGTRFPAGVLEDYADLAEGLLALHQATALPRWLAAAGSLLDVVLARFPDGRGGFHDTADDAETLIRRPWDPTDGPAPSGSVGRFISP